MIATLLRVLGLGLLVLALPAAGQTPADPQRIAEAEADLRSVQGRIQALGERLAGDRNTQDTLQAAVETLEQGISQAQAELKSLDQRLKAQQQLVREAEAERNRERARLQTQQQALGQQIRSAYLIGDRAETRLLLNQDDAQRLSRVMTYYDYLNRARTRRIRAIDAQVQKLAAVEARLRAAEAEVQGLVDQQRLALSQLEATRAERNRAIAAVEARIRESGQALKRLQQDEQQMQRLLESLQDILSDIPLKLGNSRPFPQLRGRLYRPVRSGKVIASYGQPKAGTSLTWKGLWLAAPAGTPIRAAAGGRVAYVGWMHRYGLMVILEHDGEHFTLYGHNESAAVRLGQWVQGGETLAWAGSSGGHRQSGVYFEIRRGRRPIDPRPWLSR
jgi:septal ring factor EnvC (AmiA/AmiB activator)